MLQHVLTVLKKLPFKRCISCGKEIEGRYENHSSSKCDACKIL